MVGIFFVVTRVCCYGNVVNGAVSLIYDGFWFVGTRYKDIVFSDDTGCVGEVVLWYF